METSVRTSRTSVFVQTIIGGAVVCVIFATGFSVGASLGGRTLEISVPKGVDITGTAHKKVECMQWVSDNMKDVNAGVIALMCNGKS